MDKKPEFHGSDIEQISEYYRISPASIVNFGANVNPLGLSDALKRELASNLDVITCYPDRSYTNLRLAISKYCNAKPEHIVVGNGSTELISLLILQHAPKKALIVGPTYSEYERELSLAGTSFSFFTLKETEDFAMKVEDFCSTLDQDMDLVIICNPNNPTSSAISTKDLSRILSHCKRQGIFVMVDETYVEFAPSSEDISAIPLVLDYDNVMIIRGVSKFFAAPGLRFGYGITSNQSFLSTLLMHQNPWSLNSIAAFAGEYMLADTEYIKKTQALICSERTRIYQILSSWKTVKVYPPNGNFILVKLLAQGVTADAVFEHAISHGLMIRNCSSFQSLDGEYVRFCIMKPEDNHRLLTCLEELLFNNHQHKQGGTP